jgi:hypothetical protein
MSLQPNATETEPPTQHARQDEQKEYFLLSSYWAELRGDQVVGKPVPIYHLDLKHCTFEEVKGVPPTNFVFQIDGDVPVRVSGACGGVVESNPPIPYPYPYPTLPYTTSMKGCRIHFTPIPHCDQPNDTTAGFAGWFDTDFFGNDPDRPLPAPTTLSTAPEVGYTHWVRPSIERRVPRSIGRPAIDRVLLQLLYQSDRDSPPPLPPPPPLRLLHCTGPAGLPPPRAARPPTRRPRGGVLRHAAAEGEPPPLRGRDLLLCREPGRAGLGLRQPQVPAPLGWGLNGCFRD